MNAPDPTHYGDDLDPLRACHADAAAWSAMARTAWRFTPWVLLGPQATTTAVTEHLAEVAAGSGPDDIFLLTFSGHGTQVPDATERPGAPGEEIDRYDETWALYDRLWLDDEIHTTLGQFAGRGRVVVFADSCHSQSSVRLNVIRDIDTGPPVVRLVDDVIALPQWRPRDLPYHVAARAVRNHTGAYRAAGEAAATTRTTATRLASSEVADVVLVSACRDDEVAYEDVDHGRFTAAVLDVLGSGVFEGDYHALTGRLAKQIPGQQPQRYWYPECPGSARRRVLM